MSEYSSLTQQVSPKPQLEQILSRQQRKAAGIGDAYVDMYNDSQLAKYNNDYNYWLWQQQAEYNSPKAQMERAKEAGLNPNVVAGNVSSGNLQSTPESKANYKSHIVGTEIDKINSGLNIFNSIIGAIGQGVDIVSGISGIPKDIGTYRRLLTDLPNSQYLGNLSKNQSIGLDNLLKQIEVAKELFSTGIETPNSGMVIGKDSPFAKSVEYDLTNSYLDTLFKNIKNEATQYDLNYLKPAQLDKIITDTRRSMLEAGYTEKQLEWFTADHVLGFLDGILGGVGKFTKLIK